MSRDRRRDLPDDTGNGTLGTPYFVFGLLYDEVSFDMGLVEVIPPPREPNWLLEVVEVYSESSTSWTTSSGKDG